MSRNSTRSLGALHPIVFFVVIYGISLFLAFFVCSTVYYSINDDASKETKNVSQKQYTLTNSATASAFR